MRGVISSLLGEQSLRTVHPLGHRGFLNRPKTLAVLASAATLALSGVAKAQSFVTSGLAPTGSDISQPDISQGTYTGYTDYSDNGGGIGQSFTPATNVTLSSITFKGNGGAGTNGGSLATPWKFFFGTNSYLGYGATLTQLDSETVDGTPISNDVAAGRKDWYDTFNLATPQLLTAGTRYYFAFSTAGNGAYYGFSGGAAAPQAGGAAIRINATQTSEEFTQGYDRTFFINGTPGGIRTNVNGEWKTNGSGAYETPANWVGGAVPTSTGDTALFDSDGGTITTSPTVTLSTQVSLDSLTFNYAPGSYTIANGGAGQINLGTTTPVTVLAGNHTINVPLALNNGNSNFNISVGSSLTVPTVTDGTYGGLTVLGGGSVTTGVLQNINLFINGGSTYTMTDGVATGGYIYGITTQANSTFNLGQNNSITNNSISGNGIFNVGAGSVVVTSQFGGDIFNGVLAGSGTIKIGNATTNTQYTVAFLNNNPFTGDITVTGTTILSVAAGNNLGAGGPLNTVTLDNGILQARAAFIAIQPIILTANGGTIDTNSFNASTGLINGSGTLTKINAGTLTVGPGAATTAVNPMVVGGINISAGTLAIGLAATHASRALVTTGSLTLAGSTGAWTSTLDLGNNDLLVQNSSSTFSTIANQVAMGYNGGLWNGGGNGGITSSSAAADSRHLTAVGVIQNDNGAGTNTALYSTFDGTATSNADVLVKYTYYGDANLSGKVDGSDYSRIDSAFLADKTAPGSVTGWFNGDFNYDGLVNGSDYTLIDNAFNTQGATLAAIIASPNAVSTAEVASASGSAAAVPEPGSLSLIAISTAGLLGKRRRRN